MIVKTNFVQKFWLTTALSTAVELETPPRLSTWPNAARVPVFLSEFLGKKELFASGFETLVKEVTRRRKSKAASPDQVLVQRLHKVRDLALNFFHHF
jgi:hypothetical protein